jgi:hypothetical protein
MELFKISDYLNKEIEIEFYGRSNIRNKQSKQEQRRLSPSPLHHPPLSMAIVLL